MSFLLDEKIISVVDTRHKNCEDLRKLVQEHRQSGTQRHLVICGVGFVEGLINELEAWRGEKLNGRINTD